MSFWRKRTDETHFLIFILHSGAKINSAWDTLAAAKEALGRFATQYALDPNGVLMVGDLPAPAMLLWWRDVAAIYVSKEARIL